MDELLKEMERIRDLTGAFTPLDIGLVLFLSFGLSLAVAWAYRYTHRGVSYSQSYVHTLIIMGTVVSLIMLIIGSNIARAFALVGALSIIRFRNAMKETRDVGFIFLVMAIGMAVGTRFYLLAAFATAVLCLFVVILFKFNLFAKQVRERILRIQLPLDRDPEVVLADAFRKHLEEHRIISIETVRAGVLQEAVYSVVLAASAKPQQLLEDLRRSNDNHKVSLILGQQEIDI
jgi:Ca2+/Na+ antiporter